MEVPVWRMYMGKRKMDNKLMEYILTLLNSTENGSLSWESVAYGNGEGCLSSLTESQNLRMALEVLHFMDEMPGGFLIYRAEGDQQILFANRAATRIFQCGTLQEFLELTQGSFRKMVYPDDLCQVEKSIEEQIADSKYDLDYVEYRILRKDGAVRWIEDYGHFVRSESFGGIFYVFLVDSTEKIMQRMSEREELEVIRREHLRRLEVIEGLSINYESILYADLDEDTIVSYRTSCRTEREFGNGDRVCSFCWYMKDYTDAWIHPEDRELVLKVTTPEYIRKNLADKKTYYINFRTVYQGELQYMQLRIVNVGKDKERVSQIVMGYRRVDEEIKYEMNQKKMVEEALNTTNLAIVAKNTFLSNMSHDMRTPLNAIFGFTTLAKKCRRDIDAVENYFNKIEASGKQLLDLIDRVLELSWTESKDVRITESECSLYEILNNVHKTLLPQASAKKITFFLNFSGLEHGDVYCDRDKLKQVLLYLVNNAVTYTEHGGRVEMAVMELKNLPNDFAVYRFLIKDNGIGISEGFLKHIFEPFEREKNTTVSGIHGTGLGLTIAKNLVEMMGGNIRVDSSVGRGSTFKVSLRMRIQEGQSTFSYDPEDTMEHLKRHKILVVEDNEINLEIETEILQDLGLMIDTATDGSIAVEKVKQSQPGDYILVLMDIQMPIMNGREAAEAIRRLENPALARIPIIALSANAFESDKRMSIESGMDAHLTKPMDVPLLLETIAKTLHIHKISYGDRY